jgi:hypothetical protein
MKKAINTKIPETLLENLDNYAKEFGYTRTYLVKEALNFYLNILSQSNSSSVRNLGSFALGNNGSDEKLSVFQLQLLVEEKAKNNDNNKEKRIEFIQKINRIKQLEIEYHLLKFEIKNFFSRLEYADLITPSKNFPKNPPNLEWKEIKGTFSFQEAQKKANEVGNGWRLPTFKELWYSVDRYVAKKDETKFWTDLEYTDFDNNKDKARYIQKDGYDNIIKKVEKIHLKLVRGESFYENIEFIREGDFVIDKNNSLMWFDKTHGKMGLDEAMQYADKCSEGGYHNWRIPTIEELFSITDQTQDRFNQIFKAIANEPHLSKTPTIVYHPGQWIVRYGSGNSSRSGAIHYFVCVRDLN